VCVCVCVCADVCVQGEVPHFFSDNFRIAVLNHKLSVSGV
jgi:hypothetical protein